MSSEKLLASTRAIQTHNGIEMTDPSVPLDAWELFDGPANEPQACPHFSVEMETGTGKACLCLRRSFGSGSYQ